MKEQQDRMIQEGERDEVNPWLDRTRWVQYMDGLNCDRIVQLIQEPSDDEPILQAIEKVAEGMIHHCQETIRSQVGIMV